MKKTAEAKEALMGTLLDYDLNDLKSETFQIPPQDRIRKIESLEPFEAWWIELLSEDEPQIKHIRLKIDEENIVSKKEMRDEFDIYCRNNNPRHRTWSPQKFGRYVYRLIPEISEVRPTIKKRHYRFPHLMPAESTF